MYIAIEFEWDQKKADLNLRKHGVSFETATEVFFDPHQVVSENYHYDSDGEPRWQIIGMAENLLLLLVVYVDRSEAEREIIRLIQARKADALETGIYAAYIQDQNH